MMTAASASDTRHPDGKSPDVAVIIPIFKHSGLFPEAVESVLQQHGGLEVTVVLVDDGCPFPQTQIAARAYATAFAGKVFYVRRPNGGLSAARNTGVDFALKAWPECPALYMLDADNRIGPFCLARMADALQNAPRSIGWVYPDINDFGIRGNHEPARDYSLYFHLWENYCDAGSLIRRDVFDRGIRFAESLRTGFEDWDFWLQANEAGFRGQYLRDAGFSYRRRAESMLTHAERNRTAILAEMRKRHPGVFSTRRVLALESVEAPRYAIVREDEKVILTSDPCAGGAELSADAYRERFRLAAASKGGMHVPPFTVFTTNSCLDLLEATGVLRWAFWRSEYGLEEAEIVSVAPGRAGPDETVGFDELASPMSADVLEDAALLMVRSASLGLGAGVEGERPASRQPADAAKPAVRAISLRCQPREQPASTAPPATSLRRLLDEASRIRKAREHDGAALRGTWRETAVTARSYSHDIARNLAGSGPLLPYVAQPGQTDIGFIVPLVAFGGVEKCVMNYAKVARKKGWRPHLFVFNASTAQIPHEFAEVFESINFLADPRELQPSDDTSYFGAERSPWAVGGDHPLAIGLLASMSIVFNIHSSDAHGIMSQLRHLGIKTVAGLHVVEQGGFGRPSGQPHMLLGYEHAYDLIAVISEDLRRWCVAFGVPEDKLVMLRNAPSYATADDTIDAALAERERRPASPLRLAFAGRLDHQKGLERLMALYERTRLTPGAFEWRIVGKPVLADAHVADFSPIADILEPPIYDSAGLDRLYAWADVLVLPSRFEGVPLTLLEAGRFGCVPCATRVGAVEEIVTDGVDGVLIEPAGADDEIASAFFDKLLALQRDRPALREMSRAAAARVRRTSWEANMEPLFQALEPGTGG